MQQYWNEIYNISILIWIIFQVIIGYNLLIPIIFYLSYRIARKKPDAVLPVRHTSHSNDYGIIITAYQQTHQIEDAVISALRIEHNNFMVYVVADNCDPFTLTLSDERLVMLFPEQTLANNLKSHQFAIRNFKRNHNKIVIIDSDNLVHPGFLNALDQWFNCGFKAVQGIRLPKNLDTNLARLDAARDIYYNFYDSKILFELGSSSTLSGSGMAFDFDIYTAIISTINSEGAGFDKLVQYELVNRDIRIAYADAAIVYDEKTAYSAQLLKQRSRWIKTWFNYSRLGFLLLSKGLISFNKNQSLFGLILLRPPLFIFLLLSCICLFVNLWVNPVWSMFWATGLVLFIIAFMIATFRKSTDPEILKALKNIPQFMLIQIRSILLATKVNGDNIATEHHPKIVHADSLDTDAKPLKLKPKSHEN